MKRRKNRLIQAILFIMMISLTACGESTSKAVIENKEYTLDFNVPLPDNADNSKTFYYAYHWFKDELEKRSEGRLNVKIYFNGQLAQVPEMLDAIENGTIDMGFATPSFYGNLIPEVYITNLPLWAEDIEEAYDLWYNTEIAEIYNDAFIEYGVTPLMNTYFSHSGFLLTKPVHSVADLNGLLIGSYGGLSNVWYDELGVTGADVPHLNWYDAMSRGVIDGVVTTYSTLSNLKLSEVVEYVIEPPFLSPMMATTFISNKTLEELPEDLEDILFEVAKEAELKALKGSIEDVERVLEEIENFEAEKVLEVIHLPEEEVQKLHKSIQQPLWDEFASLSEGNARMIEIIRENAEKKLK